MRSELDWLKDGAFIKAEHYGRPRTKGLISSEIHKMTREPIMSFVPLKNRKEYRENIMSMGMTPVRTFGAEVGRDKKKVMNALLEMNKKKGGGKPVSPANRGKLMQVFTPLKRGSLETITSEDGSQTGSQSVSLGRASSLQELSVEAEVDTNRDGVGGKGDGSSGGGGGRGNQRGDELQQRILQQRQMFLQQQLSEMGGGGGQGGGGGCWHNVATPIFSLWSTKLTIPPSLPFTRLAKSEASTGDGCVSAGSIHSP